MTEGTDADTRPTIALCMIVRDEERSIARAVASVRALVSEIVVVDTGSRDATPAIAQALGARVVPFAWCDDFAAARNAALQAVTADWILVLDADEAIDASELPLLGKLTADRSVCYALIQRHYIRNPQIEGFKPIDGRYPAWSRDLPGYFESSCVRFFPNGAGIEFRGRVHELAEPSIAERAGLRIAASSLRIQHYGHVSEPAHARNKSMLYARLAELKAAEAPEPWRAWYELGVERIGCRLLTESVEAFEKAARLKPDFVLTWVNLGYVLCELGRLDRAQRALDRAITLDKTCAEAYCNLGVVRMRRGQFEPAAKAFSAAIDLKTDYVAAYCNLGRALLALGNLRDAGACLTRALELQPAYVDAMADLAQVYLLAGAPGEARRLTGEALRVRVNDPQLLYVAAQALRCEGMLGEAAEHLRRSIRVLEERQGGAPSALLDGMRRDLDTLSRLPQA